MRTHTSQFKDEIKQYGRQFNDTIYYNNTTYDGEHIFSVNYSVDTTLCKSVMQTLTIDTDISMNVGDTLDYGISVVGATDEIRFNGFIVNKIEEQKDKKSSLITCYDNMIKSMKDYETPKVNNVAITFPITIRDYLIAICGQLGLTFKNASDTFTNYDKNITSEHYIDTDGNSLGYTFRDVLDDIAEATGSFICIDNNGQLEIKGFTNTQDTINEDYFSDKNVNIGKKIGPYNVVVLSRASDSDNIHYPATLPSNPIEFKISDNAILEQDNREDFIQGIYNKIKGLGFYLNDFATNGILYYEIGDKYNVSIDSVTYPCLMLSDDIKRTTGLKENIRTDEPKQSVTEFKYASSSDKVEITSRNAKILVDKANASINQIVSAVGDNGQVTSASIIQSINNDTSQIKLEADKIDLNGAITANGNFIINQDGSVEVNSGKLSLKDSGVSNPAIQITSTVTNNKSRLSSEVISLTNSTSTKKTEIHNGSYTVSSKNSSNIPQGAYIYPDDLGFSHWIEDGNGNDVRVANFTRGKDNGNAIELLYTGTTNFSVTNNSTGSDMLLNGNATISGNNTTTGYTQTQSIVAKEDRPSTPNFDHQYPNNRASKRFDIASNYMDSSGYKPKSDGWIETFFWDNSGQYDAQFFIPNNTGTPLQYRAKNGLSSWANDWKSIASNDWCVATKPRFTMQSSAWTETNVSWNSASDTFITSDNSLFELTSTGIKCKFTGAVVIIRDCSIDYTSEFDLVDQYGTNYHVNGSIKKDITIETVNNGDIKSLIYITGSTNITFYSTRMFIMRIQ